MKRFVIKLFCIFIPLIMGLILIAVISYGKFRSRVFSAYKCTPGIEYVAIGDSRIETGIDTNVLSNVRNMGVSAIVLSINQVRAKLVADTFTNADMTIIMNVWPTSLFRPHKESFDNSIPAEAAWYEIYDSKFMPQKDLDFVIRYVNGVAKPWICNKIIIIDGAYLGRTENARFNKWGKKETYVGMVPIKVQEGKAVGELILKDLIVYLQAKKIKLILVTMPIYKWFAEKQYPPDVMEKFTAVMNAIDELPNVVWLDYMNECNDNIELWADGYHLNKWGACAFSKKFKDDLRMLKRRSDW